MSSSSGEQFSLVWNTFPTNLSTGLYSLLTGEQLVDVTLAAEGRILRAHKLILSVCSSYFRELFKGNTCKHPIVILKDVNYRDLSAMLHFMYQGEVNIKQEDIASFLKVAEALKIKGLTRSPDDDDESEKDLAHSLPLIREERSAAQADHSKSSPSWSACQCKEDVSIKPYDALLQPPPSLDAHMQDAESCRDDAPEDEPLDCSASTDDKQAPPAEFEPELTPKLECVQLPAEQDAPENLINAPMLFSAPHCQADSVGFHDTGTRCTTGGGGVEFYDPSTSGGNNNSSTKGRRTVKGLPGSSLSLETTLRVISELGPTIRMERGKIIRMYSCPWCLRHFTRKENLKLHVRYIHGPLESLTCKLCGNKYKNSNSLRVHSYLYHNAQRNKSTGASSEGSGGGGGGDKPIVGGSA